MIEKNQYLGGLATLIEKMFKSFMQTAVWSDNIHTDVDYDVTASTGSTQATGYKITKTVTEIGTCGNAGDSCTLPKSAKGKYFEIKNNGANSSDIFPPLGGAIDTGGANAAVAVANTKSGKFICTSAAATTSTWSSLYTD